MAQKAYQITDDLATNSNYGRLQEFDLEYISPIGFDYILPTGWKMTTQAKNTSSLMRVGVIKAPSSFIVNSTNIEQPPNNSLADCFRTELPITGTFDSGVWTINFNLLYEFGAINPGSTLGSGKMQLYIWKSKLPSASSFPDALPIMGSFNSSLVDFSGGGTTRNAQYSLELSRIDLENEYLFFKLGWLITRAGTSGTSVTTKFRQDDDSISRIVTSNFSPVQNVTYDGNSPGSIGNILEMSPSADLVVSPGSVDIALEENNTIDSVTHVDSSIITPGPANITFSGFDVDPVFDEDNEVGYTAREVNWLLGEHII